MNSARMIIFIMALTGTGVLLGPCILALLVKKWRSEFPRVAIPFALSLVTFLVVSFNNGNAELSNVHTNDPIEKNNSVLTADIQSYKPEELVLQPTVLTPDVVTPDYSYTNDFKADYQVIYEIKTGDSTTTVTSKENPPGQIDKTDSSENANYEISNSQVSDTGNTTNDNQKTNEVNNDSELVVYFIDVGQGDATLIVCDGEAMIIDLAADKGTVMKKYLNNLGLTSIKYVIGTHPDEDHIGSLDVVFENYTCETIIMPDIPAETKTHQKILDSIEYMNYKITEPVVGDKYYLGGASFTIIGPKTIYSSDDNNSSVAIKLTHGENSFIFTGDAESKEEADIIASGFDLKADVLKLGHHGCKTSTTKEFLDAVTPIYAVISCGASNNHGHPNEETLEKLKAAGCKVFRTDEQGTIVATSDGKNLTFSCNPSETWTPGEKTDSGESTKTEVISNNPDNSNSTTGSIPEGTTYILNLNTKKFHRLTCDDVNDMKEKNKGYTNKTREEIINDGYSPCKHCKP